MTPAYDLQKIRTLLREGFTAEELRYFCTVYPAFQPLQAQLAEINDEAELADIISAHAETTNQVETLLTWAKKHNVTQYEAHAPYIIPPSEKAEQQIKEAVRRVPPTRAVGSTIPTTTTDSAPGNESSEVTIGTVRGSIEDATIAGRDVTRTSVGQTIVNVLRGVGRSSPAQRNRQAMLKRVRHFWIEGLLEKSLHGLAMIELGMAEKADAVENPLGLTLKTAGQPEQLLSSGTKIIAVFDQMDRALLILGEPGSGKTMTLLALARDTIAAAEKDPTKPIPVVFNLSSWSTEQKPLAEWLVDELKVKYQIPAKIGQAWIDNRELLLLLDGLDEVASAQREACVGALNDFSRSYGLKNIAVCSRIADYEALTGRLALPGAILLQPLTSSQVDTYLRQAGLKLDAVRTLIEEDQVLREFTRSPLTLSVMALAYQGESVEALRGFDLVEARRDHLFETYIDRMFRRKVRTSYEPYPRQQTLAWLSWLAEKLSSHAQNLFLIEQMQPTLLGSWAQRLFAMSFMLIYTSLWSAGLILLWRSFFPLSCLPCIIGVLIVFIALNTLTVTIFPKSIFPKSDTIFPKSRLPGGERLLEIKTLRIFKLRPTPWTAALALAAGLAVAVFFLILTSLDDELNASPLTLFWRPALWVVMYVWTLLSLTDDEFETTAFPNQGIRQSLKIGLVVALAVTVTILITGTPFEWLELFELVDESVGLIWLRVVPAFVLGTMFGFVLSGQSVLKHYILRFMLYWQGHLPWRYDHFLDYAAERIFLRKVGGGYIFIHRLLLEHFASLEPEQDGKQ